MPELMQQVGLFVFKRGVVAMGRGRFSSIVSHEGAVHSSSRLFQRRKPVSASVFLLVFFFNQIPMIGVSAGTGWCGIICAEGKKRFANLEYVR